MNFKFNHHLVAVVADLHLGIHQSSDTWLTLAYDWAQWFANQLDKHQITDIVICGDIFHYRSEIAVNVLHKVSQIFDIWKKYNIIILCGNHDSFFKDHSHVNSIDILKSRYNVQVVSGDPFTHEQFNKRITFAPWGTEIHNLNKCDILFGHFEINSFTMNGSLTCNDGIEPDQILSISPLVISGHFHLRSDRKYKNGNILYVGNPFHMDLSDTGSKKGIYFVDLKTSTYNFLENNFSPSIVKISLSAMVDEGHISDYYKKLIRGNIVRFYIDIDVSPDDIDIILTKIRSLEPLILTPEYDNNFNKFKLVESDNYISGVDIPQAIAEFIGLMDITNKTELIKYVTEIYNSCK